MRIMYDSEAVAEITTIDVSKCWHSNKEVNEDNPDDYVVSIDGEYVGNYNIHSDAQLFREAKENFESICEQLLVKGYCRASDFKNFTWY